MIPLELKQEILQRTAKCIADDFGVFPWIATEIEFYVLGFGEVDQIANDVMYSLTGEIKASGLNYIKLEKERGKSQYEVAMRHVPDALEAATSTERLKEVIKGASEEICLEADFGAKPVEGEFGSGLHIHVSLHDKQGNNLFQKSGDSSYSELLLYAAGGMLATMKDFMILFAPEKESYARFEAGMNVPVTVSWGTNNRTTALRLPSSTDLTRHIEHRVSGSDADPHLAIAAVLAGVHYGIKEKITPPEQIFGDASLSMYNLESLPKSLEESRKHFKNSAIAKAYFPEFSKFA